MSKNKDYLKLLELDNDELEVEEIIEDDSGLTVTVKRIKTDDNECPNCKNKKLKIHGYIIKRINHTFSLSKKCNLLYKKRRFKCLNCSSTFFEVNYFNFGYSRVSDNTVSLILKELKKEQSFKDIGDKFHLSSQTIINYMDRYIDPKRRKLPEILSIDEFKNLSNGKGKYACLLLNYQTREIVDILPDRRLDTLQYYFNKISIEERRNVKYLISDMYDGYKHLALNLFPNSTLVIDGFHYIRYILDALNSIRIRIQNKYQKSTNEYKMLKSNRKFINMYSKKLPSFKRKYSYTNDIIDCNELVERCLKLDDDLEKGYNLKEVFLSSYKYQKKENAQTFINCFINNLRDSNVKELVDVGDTFDSWKEYIINSFNRDINGKRMSNGPIEGTNNKIKVTKRISYGYTDFYHFRNRLMYIFNDEKPLLVPKDLNKVKELKRPFYKPRKKYVKGYLHSPNILINAYGIKDKDDPYHPLLSDAEAIKYIKSCNLTNEELKELNIWIKEDNTFYSNPLKMLDNDGQELNYIDYLKAKK